MVTLILLGLALLPAPPEFGTSLPDPGAGQAALSPKLPVEESCLPFLVRTETADEESEDEKEEWDEPGPVHFVPGSLDDPCLILPTRGANGSPHLPIARDRRDCPRSPPR